MAGNFRNIRLGPCKIFWGLEELGYTQGSVDVSIASTKVDVKADQWGDNSIDSYIASRTVNVTVPLVETTPGHLDRIINNGDGSAATSIVIADSGTSMRQNAQTLVLHPISKAEDDYSEDFLVICASISPNIQMEYSENEERVWKVTFNSYPYYGDKGYIPYVDNSGVIVYGDRSSILTRDGIIRSSNRSTFGTYIGADGLLKTAPPYAQRPNYVYQNGVWVQQGFLREGQSTNYILNANEPVRNWGAVDIKDMGLAPDGISQFRGVVSRGGGGYGTRDAPVPFSGSFTASMYVNPLKWSSPYFELVKNGTQLPRSIGTISLSPQLARIWQTGNYTKGDTFRLQIDGDEGSSIWGMMFEPTPDTGLPSSFIYTTSSAQTRAAD